MVGTTKILSAVLNSKDLRNPSRLYFWTATNIGSKVHKSDLKGPILGAFSPYQIKKYFSVLRRAGWVGLDRDGNFYLRSMETILVREGLAVKSKRYRAIDIPAGAMNGNKAWLDFLAGTYVLAMASSLRWGSSRKRSKCYAADNNAGKPFLTLDSKTVANSSIAQGVSIELLSRSSGCHESTASRWRDRGEAAGYKLVRAFLPTNYLQKPDLGYLEELKDEQVPGWWKLRLLKGRIVEEVPSLVCLDKPLISTRRIGRVGKK